MKIISLYLALFLGTILAATDAAPRGSDKAAETPSLRQLKGGKGGGKGGGEITTLPVSEGGDSKGGDSKGGDGKTGEIECEGEDCGDDAVGHAESAELFCQILETFDTMGRDGNGDGLHWSALCDGYDAWDMVLCPPPESVEAICLENKPYNNRAVKTNWCIPLFGSIEDVDRSADCIKFCTNFVSEARGGCCNIDCGDEN
jgi:hypothetical protein